MPIYFKIGRSTKRFVFFEFILFLHTCYICVCFQLVAFMREHMGHKALLMGYSMRLKLTLVSSLIDFQLVRLGYTPFFLECVYFGLLTPLLYLICLSLCVYEWVSVCLGDFLLCGFKFTRDSFPTPFFIIFTNPSARAGYDTRSIFKWSLTGLNSEFSFS